MSRAARQPEQHKDCDTAADDGRPPSSLRPGGGSTDISVNRVACLRRREILVRMSRHRRRIEQTVCRHGPWLAVVVGIRSDPLRRAVEQWSMRPAVCRPDRLRCRDIAVLDRRGAADGPGIRAAIRCAVQPFKQRGPGGWIQARRGEGNRIPAACRTASAGRFSGRER